MVIFIVIHVAVVWHLSIPLMNSFNKTEAAISHAGFASFFPFYQINV